MVTLISNPSVNVLQDSAHGLSGKARDYDPLLKLIGDARCVLLGEATHGTHEFYRARAEITKRLILEKGFTVIALEADWPGALRINRFIRGADGMNADDALKGFRHFPTWMWRNTDMLDFIGWLRDHNASLRPKASKVGVYGLDLYSLHASMGAVVRYLEKIDPPAARAARQRYSCFDQFGDDPQRYGYVTSQDPFASCEEAVIQQLVELQKHAADCLAKDGHDGRMALDELFFAEQNACVAKDAERYYRAMYRGRPNTWNLRDTHMVETLEDLMWHLQAQGEQSKAVVWAHNSHLGDARATQMSGRGEFNVGQLIRERHQRDAVLVGFTTYTGTVTAASEWGGRAERKIILPATEDSYEALFHETAIPQFLLTIRGDSRLTATLNPQRLERAIGVVYRADTESWSHYFEASLSHQFDAVIHFDETSGVQPLEETAARVAGEFPETYPSGL